MIPSKDNPPTYEQFIELIQATVNADHRIVFVLTNVSERLKRNTITISDATNELDFLCDDMMSAIKARLDVFPESSPWHP